MPELLIMRHAKSAWDTGDVDFDRPLAPRGRSDRARMARWVFDRGLAPDLVLTSAATRARETAVHVAETCRLDDAAVIIDERLYSAGAVQWLGRLRDLDDGVHRALICGHNPALDHLVETLSATTPSLSQTGKLMTTAAIAHLSFAMPWAELHPVSGTLHGIARPKEL